MINNKIHKKTIAFFLYGLIINSLGLFLHQAKAGQVYAGSPLCLSREMNTVIGLSSNQLKAAICATKSEYNVYYIGQKKGLSKPLVLPIANKSHYVPNPGEGLLYKAQNGSYTYQVFATCHPFEQHKDWSTISVFKDGKKIYYQKFNNYFVDSGWCNDAFGQQN